MAGKDPSDVVDFERRALRRARPQNHNDFPCRFGPCLGYLGLFQALRFARVAGFFVPWHYARPPFIPLGAVRRAVREARAPCARLASVRRLRAGNDL